jgi:hypothetical protein
MSKRILVGVFEREADLVRAVMAMRAADLRIDDVYAPYAIHGLDRWLGRSSCSGFKGGPRR